MKQLFKSAILLAMLALSFTACKDSDNTPALTMADVQGEYVGTFDFVGEPSDINPDGVSKDGVAISLKVENGKITLPAFPATTLVEALLGEEGAADIIPMLGVVSYEATIGQAAASGEAFSAPLTTGRLDIPVGPEGMTIMTVQIDITAPVDYDLRGS